MEGVIARSIGLPLSMITTEQEDARSKGEVIHSGHFMISSVADQDDIDDDVSHDRDSPLHHEQVIRLREGYDFSEVRKETQNTYQFGHRSTNQITIDASLSRLFECMSLAYRGGKVVSPKWKNFKGMRLSVKDKIRLNNAIWRTWHIQYIMKKKRNKISFVQFATPLDIDSDCDSHSKPEAVVMEGKYWKRRIETVVAEYKKWRAFFMDKLQQSDHPGLTWVSNQSAPSTPESFHYNFDAMMKADDNTFADLADRLFRGLSQPFQFPNPREIAQHATNSDMMQPGLLQLQPPIDDFMDPLDTLQDIFSPTRKSSMNGAANNVSLFYAGNNNTHSASVAQLDFPTPMITQQDFSAPGMQESSLEELVQKATAGFDVPPLGPLADDMARIPMRQQLTPMQVQQQNNYGVSDPMLSRTANEQIFSQVQNAPIPTTAPMMISKQHQITPTISQVVVSRPQHHQQLVTLPASYNSMQAAKIPQITMPPPQKAPPRRKSQHKTHNNVGTAPMQVAQQLSTAAEVPMMVNYAQTKNNIGSNQGQMPPGYPVTVQQVTMTPHLGNLSVSQQPVQMQVDKVPPSRQLNVQTVVPQVPVQDVSIEALNPNTQAMSESVNTEATNRLPPTLIIPITLQQAIHQYVNNSSDQAPLKKQRMSNQVANPGIVVKQPSSTVLNSQHISARQQTFLTQLLTSGRVDGKNQTLQLPPNVMLAPTREAQLKQVREQAANFNTFQNSVLMAAAQMATAPQSQQQMETPADNSTSINLGATNSARNQTLSKPFAADPQQSPAKDITKVDDNLQSSKIPWGLATETHVVTMDTDEGPSRAKDDFLNQMEEKSYSASPASSSSSTCGDQRTYHFTAEQKRRCNIKSLCDRLQDILPELSNHPNQKVSKAVLLSKSCQYIRQLQNTRQQTTAEIQKLKKKVETLNEDISNFQQQLPATGAPVSRHRGDRMKAIFDEWVRDRTLTDWKFFIFSMIIRPWFMSYDDTVSNSSMDELCRSCVMWLEKHCSMLALRRGVVNSLQELGTTTSILTDPTTLQQQAESAVQQKSRHSSSSS